MVLSIPVLPLRPCWHLVSICLRSTHERASHFDTISSIIGSLAGTSYYGPVAGHGILSHDLEVIRMARKQYDVERSGTVGGDIEALPAPENAESYVILKKKQHDEGKPEGEAGKNENE